MHLTKKQYEALIYLQDNETNEIAFGGGAGGGKSVLGCYWILKNCFKYPGTRWLIGRSVLKTLKETTIKTLFEVMKEQGISNRFYTYNQQANEIKFINKSEIIFKDLYLQPSDPNMDELGSLEITGAFIDEAVQIKEKTRNIVKSRIRFKLDEFGLIPKILYCTNPGRGWIYDDFYKPSITGTLPSNRKYVRSLLKDNHFISEHYQANLEALDKESRERLLHGNWDFEQEGYVFQESKINWFKLSDINLDECIIMDYADVADSGTCYFSKPIAAIHGHKVYVIDWIYTDKPLEFWAPIDIAKIKHYNPVISFYESNGAGLMATKYIKEKIGKPYSDIIKALPETKNKMDRIKLAAETDILPNFYFLSNPEGMYKEAFNHVLQYRYDETFKIIDAPDSLAGLSKVTKKYRK